MSLCMQLSASFILCLPAINLCIQFAWPSSSLPLLRSNETVLTRPLTDGEASLLCSIASLSALVSCPLMGFLLDRIGRKYCAILCASCSVICWAMISFTNKIEVVLAGLFISGVNSAAFLVGGVFISEFCQDSLRGTLTAGPGNFSAVGSLLSYLLGGLLDYYMMAYVSLGISISTLLLLCWLKESPVYLMMIGKEKAAIKSLVFYKRKKANSNEVRQELENIRRALTVHLNDSNEEKEESPDEEGLMTTKKPDISPGEYFKQSRVARRAFYISMVLVWALIFQGAVIVQVHAGSLFLEVVPEMSSSLCSILFGVVYAVCGFPTAYLSDRIGRRPLLIHASFAAGVCCILCGTQIQWAWGPNWFTPVFIYLFIAFYTFGVGALVLVFIVEIFVPEVKSYINMICNEWMLICNFIILMIFDPLTKIVGLGGVFHLFGIICILTGIFCYIFVPETKGLSIDKIQALF